MSQELWKKASDRILRLEGGKVTDHAGPTNMGITLRFLIATSNSDLDGDGFLEGDFDFDGDVDQSDLDVMTPEQALDLYKREFWDRYGYGELHHIGEVSLKIFDLSVNCGPKQAHKFLQRAARACGEPLIDDGILGPRSKAAISRIAGIRLASAMSSEAAGFYRLICAKNPSYQKYLNGWLRRAYEM